MTARLNYSGIIERYRERLPVSDSTPVVSLNEGNTPLIELESAAKSVGGRVKLFAKYEGMNPTGSFKDRGMAMAVSKSVEEGSRAIVCASTGNTSAAAAAYAARAGLTAFVLVPDGKIALGKLAQAMMHGAVVMQIKGNFDQGMQLVKEVSAKLPVSLVNSVNPFRLEGQKTAAFEIVDELGDAPDYHCLPVGNAGNISAYWMGYKEYFADGTASELPQMCGYQAAGAAPLVRGHAVEKPETVATAIRIGNPQSWNKAVEAQRDSEGWFDEFSDEEILTAQRLLAEREGVFCEPASAIALAGALRDIQSGRIRNESTVVCTLTGHGLKDPDTAIGQCNRSPTVVEAKLDSVRRVIEESMAM